MKGSSYGNCIKPYISDENYLCFSKSFKILTIFSVKNFKEEVMEFSLGNGSLIDYCSLPNDKVAIASDLQTIVILKVNKTEKQITVSQNLIFQNYGKFMNVEPPKGQRERLKFSKIMLCPNSENIIVYCPARMDQKINEFRLLTIQIKKPNFRLSPKSLIYSKRIRENLNRCRAVGIIGNITKTFFFVGIEEFLSEDYCFYFTIIGYNSFNRKKLIERRIKLGQGGDKLGILRKIEPSARGLRGVDCNLNLVEIEF